MNQASEEQVIEEFRLFMRQSFAEQGVGTPIHGITAQLNVVSEHIAAMLERPSIVFLTVCFSLTMLFVLLIPSLYDSSKAPANGMTSQNDPQMERSSPADLLTRNSVSGRNASFIIRVGAFRNPVNAQRVVESLRKRALDVQTQTLASGLYVVTLGPFAARNVADDTARSVREAVGLVPQILPTASGILSRTASLRR